MQEIWKKVDGFEEIYEVSNTGKIKSVQHVIVRKNGKPLTVSEKILKGSKDTKGYLQVELKKNGKRNIRLIHRLVAEAFIPKVKGKTQVNHKDGNKENNSVDNLEWVTCQENIRHAWDNGLNRPRYGEKHPNHKLTEEQVRYIRKHYKPRDKKYGIRALARMFNVTEYPIAQIVKMKGWKTVK